MSHIKSRGPMPPDLEQLWETQLASIDRAEVEASFAKIDAAAAEHNFSGFVRRCVHRGGKPLSFLAEEVHVDVQRLGRFMRAEGELEAGEIGRILTAVGVELVETGRVA